MRLTKNHLLFVAAILGITVLYFILRTFHLTNLPLFTDEAIYIRWSQIAKQDANWRFISLTDGKQPMFIWVAAIFLKLIKDPLEAVRMVSVFAGFATTIGLFFLGNEIFRKKVKNEDYKLFEFTKAGVSIGLLSSFIYVLYPFGLVYDRMALYDSMVGTFAVWSLYILLLLARSLRLDIALISGLTIGAGMLTKTNADFSLYSMPFLLVLFDWKQKLLKNRLVKFITLSIVVAILSNAMYSILRLSPFFHIIAQKNALFVYPVGEWIHNPFAYIPSNLPRLLNWFVEYFSVSFILLGLVAFFINRQNFREKVLLILWFTFPFTALAFFGNTIYPRFILFMTIPLIILVAYSVYELFERYKNSLARLVVVIFTFGILIYADYFILFDFAHAPIPEPDTSQFVNSWSAGNGVAQSVAYFRQQSENQKIFVATEGTFGLMPFGLEMYFADNPNVKTLGIWPIHATPPQVVLDDARRMPTYAIFYQACPDCASPGEIPAGWHAVKIASYKQGISNAYYSIYKILP